MPARPADTNFIEDLRSASSPRPDADFLLAPGQPPLSHRSFWDRVARMATVLTEAGVAPGDRVVAQVDKSVDALVLYCATLYAGAVHVPLNCAFMPDELAYFIDNSTPALAIVAPGQAEETARHHAVGSLTLDVDGRGTLTEAADQAAEAQLQTRRGDDLAALIYTSGTTGRPKGARLTHDNLRLNGWALHDAWCFTADDHLVHGLPIHHVHGLFVAMHCAMLSAAKVTFLPRFDVDSVIAELRDATVFMGVPTHYRRLLQSPSLDRAACAAMRLFTCGSAPLAAPLFDGFTERTGHVICERYGMSETLITFTNPYVGDRIAGTVGFAVSAVEARVVDESGTPAAVGSTGMLQVKGPQVMSRYWRRPELATNSRDGEWFVTGDLGSLDLDGRLTLEGRAGDLIITGGENINPKEIEMALNSIPEVLECAVVGLPHADLGEAVTAFVVGTDTITEPAIREALSTALAGFKHPKAIIRVEELPLNSMGKIQKAILRHEYADRYSTDS